MSAGDYLRGNAIHTATVAPMGSAVPMPSGKTKASTISTAVTNEARDQRARRCPGMTEAAPVLRGHVEARRDRPEGRGQRDLSRGVELEGGDAIGRRPVRGRVGPGGGGRVRVGLGHLVDAGYASRCARIYAPRATRCAAPLTNGPARAGGAQVRALQSGLIMTLSLVARWQRCAHAGLLALLAQVLTGCSDHRSMPARSSPVPEPVDDPGVPRNALLDVARAEPTWYEPDSGRVWRLRGGVVQPVQERVFSELAGGPPPDALRVLPDDTVVFDTWLGILLYPADGSPPEVEEPVRNFGLAVDGTALHDVWYSIVRIDPTEEYVLCHRTAAGTDCSVVLPLGAVMPRVAVGADGSVYVGGMEKSLYRYKDGTLSLVGEQPGMADRFRPSDEGVLVLGYPGVWAVRGDAFTQIDVGEGRGVLDAVGRPSDAFVAWGDSESATVGSDCGEYFDGSDPCMVQVYWTELVVNRVRPSGVTEVAHESCNLEASDPANVCDRSLRAIGLDGDRLVLVGAPLRTVRISP